MSVKESGVRVKYWVCDGPEKGSALTTSSSSRPPASSPEALQRMIRQKRRDTSPEITDVWLGRLPLAEQLLGLLVGDRTGDDHILALLPVDRCGDLVVGGQLQ